MKLSMSKCVDFTRVGDDKKEQLSSVIEKSDLNITTVLNAICAGSSIIFITESKKLIGCITNGDIKRALNDNKANIEFSFSDCINYYSKRIVYKNEQQAWEEAFQIFEQYSKICDIPVVDEEGIICYFYKRQGLNLNEHLFNTLLLSTNEQSSLKNMFQWFGNRKYLLVISDMITSTIFEDTIKIFQKTIATLQMDISFEYYDCFHLPQLNGDEVIICWNSLVKNYIEYSYGYTSNTYVLIEELYHFDTILDIVDVQTITANAIQNWCTLLEYKEIIFPFENHFTRYIEDVLSPLNVKFHYDLYGCGMLNVEIVCYSDDHKRKDFYFLREFLELLFYINQYNAIENAQLLREHIKCYDSKNTFSINLCKTIIRTKVNDCVIRRIKQCCNNVYIHKSEISEMLPLQLECTPSVYCYGYFPYNKRDFLKEMYNNTEIDLNARYVDYIDNENIVKINKNYTKYQSNISSECISTDLYGNRLVKGTSCNNKANIYIC